MNKRDLLDNLEKIMSFLVVAENPSLHQASKQLHISQPSLSVKMKLLEETLGVTLFNRTPAGIELTKDGVKLKEFALEIDRRSDNLVRNIQQKGLPFGGIIRIGVYESIARYLWPKFYATFTKEHPELKIQLTTGRSSTLIKRLRNKKIDMALTIEPPYQTDLIHKDLYYDKFSFYCSHRHVGKYGLVKKGTHRFTLVKSDFDRASFICFGDALGEGARPLSESLVKSGFSLENINEVESFEITLEFCLKGLGIAVLPNRVARDSYHKDKLVKVDIPGLQTIDFGRHRISFSCLKHNQEMEKFEFLSEKLLELKN